MGVHIGATRQIRLIDCAQRLLELGSAARRRSLISNYSGQSCDNYQRRESAGERERDESESIVAGAARLRDSPLQRLTCTVRRLLPVLSRKTCSIILFCIYCIITQPLYNVSVYLCLPANISQKPDIQNFGECCLWPRGLVFRVR